VKRERHVLGDGMKLKSVYHTSIEDDVRMALNVFGEDSNCCIYRRMTALLLLLLDIPTTTTLRDNSGLDDTSEDHMNVG